MLRLSIFHRPGFVALLLACFLAPLSAAADTITLGGVGSLTPIIQLLGTEYAKKNPGVDVVVIDPPMGSSGGLRALAAGKIDIAPRPAPRKRTKPARQNPGCKRRWCWPPTASNKP